MCPALADGKIYLYKWSFRYVGTLNDPYLYISLDGKNCFGLCGVLANRDTSHGLFFCSSLKWRILKTLQDLNPSFLSEKFQWREWSPSGRCLPSCWSRQGWSRTSGCCAWHGGLESALCKKALVSLIALYIAYKNHVSLHFHRNNVAYGENPPNRTINMTDWCHIWQNRSKFAM